MARRLWHSASLALLGLVWIAAGSTSQAGVPRPLSATTQDNTGWTGTILSNELWLYSVRAASRQGATPWRCGRKVSQ
jgi:hypothetical protein